jgi:hypothetical protein
VIVAYLVDTDLQIIQPILISYFFEDVRIEDFVLGKNKKHSIEHKEIKKTRTDRASITISIIF